MRHYDLDARLDHMRGDGDDDHGWPGCEHCDRPAREVCPECLGFIVDDRETEVDCGCFCRDPLHDEEVIVCSVHYIRLAAQNTDYPQDGGMST